MTTEREKNTAEDAPLSGLALWALAFGCVIGWGSFVMPGTTFLPKAGPGGTEGSGDYELRVKDTGIGMAPEFAARVFEAFEREKTSTVSGIQGTGLGMAITKSIVDLMNGTIDVDTAPGEGTEFTVKLRLRLQEESQPARSIPELKGTHALVVDDDFNTCDSLTKMPSDLGLRPEWTLSGKEAVLRARQARDRSDEFGLFIIDWRLPDLGGLEFLMIPQSKSEVEASGPGRAGDHPAAAAGGGGKGARAADYRL